MIEVLSSSAANTIQDAGRPGFMSIGISRGGVMDDLAFAAANALIGNPPEAAVIEVCLFPFRILFHVDVPVAVTGAADDVRLDDRPLASSWAVNAKKGQRLAISAPARGARVYVAFGGGIDVPDVLGSKSTDLKSAFGGLDGRGLTRGDRLALLAYAGRPPELPARGHGVLTYGEEVLASAAGAPTVVRVIPAGEFGAFKPAAQKALFESMWTVTREANRMGCRLDGPELNLAKKLELLSHGIVPGTIQVPPSGQPIIQLVDANTCGGYPKIATVIQADMWRLAQTPVNGRLKFVLCDLPGAHAIAARQAAYAARIRESMRQAIASKAP